MKRSIASGRCNKSWSAALVGVAVIVSAVGSAAPSMASVPGLDFTKTGCESFSDSVARLYTAGLGREPEQGGFEYWLEQYTGGVLNLMDMASYFISSAEFDAKYGSLDQLEFIGQLYENVLGRPGEDTGIEYWDGLMTGGLTRGQMLLLFAESPENIQRSGTTTPTLGVFNTGFDRSWTCLGWAPGAPAAPAGPELPAPAGPELPIPSEPVVSNPVAPAEPAVISNPGNTKNCGDFATHAEAQKWFDRYFPKYGDVARLDGDHDGIACESLP